MTGRLTLEQARRLVGLAADACALSVADGAAIDGDGAAWAAAHDAAHRARCDLLAALVELASADAPATASCVSYGGIVPDEATETSAAVAE